MRGAMGNAPPSLRANSLSVKYVLFYCMDSIRDSRHLTMKLNLNGVIMRVLFATVVCFLVSSSAACAGKADILGVEIERTEDGYLNVSATVQHDDEGWEHYADRWEILDSQGTLLDTRVLRHPHSTTPFTRSLLRARIPENLEVIEVRAHDNVHGYGGKVVEKAVPKM